MLPLRFDHVAEAVRDTCDPLCSNKKYIKAIARKRASRSALCNACIMRAQPECRRVEERDDLEKKCLSTRALIFLEDLCVQFHSRGTRFLEILVAIRVEIQGAGSWQGSPDLGSQKLPWKESPRD